MQFTYMLKLTCVKYFNVFTLLMRKLMLRVRSGIQLEYYGADPSL